jgi:hypothetical protein
LNQNATATVPRQISRTVLALLRPVSVRDLQRREYEYLDRIRRERKFVFVTGMHRSGTTFLAKYLAKHVLASGFASIPGDMDEGQFVQNVFPTDSAFGGMGYFGYHPRSRMIETSEQRHRDIGVSLLKDWLVYLDRHAEFFIEKSPSNFRRARLLSAAFPNSSFIHVVRHPVATALALDSFSPMTFGVNGRSIPSLVRHWQHCQHQALSDYEVVRRKGNNVIVVALEDLPRVAEQLGDILKQQIGLPIDTGDLRDALQTCPNDKYRERFAEALATSPDLLSSPRLDLAFDRFGYSRTDIAAAPGYTDWLAPYRSPTPPAPLAALASAALPFGPFVATSGPAI